MVKYNYENINRIIIYDSGISTDIIIFNGGIVMSEFELDVIEKLDLHNTITQLFNIHDVLPNTNPSSVVVWKIDKDLCTVRVNIKQGECYQLTINHNTKTVLHLSKVIDLFEKNNTLQWNLCKTLHEVLK